MSHAYTCELPADRKRKKWCAWRLTAKIEPAKCEQQCKGFLAGLVAIVNVVPIIAIFDRNEGGRGRLVPPAGMHGEQVSGDSPSIERPPIGPSRQPDESLGEVLSARTSTPLAR